MGPDVAIAGSNNICSLAFSRANEVFSENFHNHRSCAQKVQNLPKDGDTCLSFCSSVVLFAPLFLQHESGRCGRHPCGISSLSFPQHNHVKISLFSQFLSDHVLIYKRLLGQVL